MADLVQGTSVIITNGAFQDMSGTIVAVENNRVVVAVTLFGRVTEIDLRADQLLLIENVVQPVESGPFWTGDQVFIHAGSGSGNAGTITVVIPDRQLCKIALEDGTETFLRFDQISLIAPERRPPDSDYLAAILQAVPMRGLAYRETYWWAQQAQRTWKMAELPELHTAFVTFERELRAAIATERDRWRERFEQSFAGLSHVKKVDKWREEWRFWIDWRPDARQSTDALKRTLLSDAEIQQLRADALLTADQFYGLPDEQVQELAVNHRVETLLDAGRTLRRRCENYTARQERPGYAYDRVPFRPVHLAHPASVLHAPAPPAARPARSTPEHLPSREHALRSLENTDELFGAALARLARDGDDEAVAALETKLAALSAIESWDEARFDQIAQLKSALLATGREHAARTAVTAIAGPGVHRGPLEVEALLLRASSAQPWPANAWGLSIEDVDEAISRLWTPLAEKAPQFIRHLNRRVLALTLLRIENSDEQLLGYVHLVPYGRYELERRGMQRPQPTTLSLDNLWQWVGFGRLALLLGYPPRDPNDDMLEHLPGFRLPIALRELYSVHAGLVTAGGGAYIAPPFWVKRLSAFCGDKPELFFDSTDGSLPDQFVSFASDDWGDATVFDLDQLDTHHDPLVADWDHETWGLSDRIGFWERFEADTPRNLLRLADEA